MRNHPNYSQSSLDITINHYKNQMFRNNPKHILMAPPTCYKKRCRCHKLDFHGILRMIIERRQQYVQTLRIRLKLSTDNKVRARLTKQIQNLSLTSSNYLFVGENGSIWTPSMFTKIVKEFVENTKPQNATSITSYSFRIGGTTLAHHQLIDLLRLCRYIAWSVEAMPHVSARYIAFRPQELMSIPFEMVHGAILSDRLSCIDRSHLKMKVFNPWNAKANMLTSLFQQKR